MVSPLLAFSMYSNPVDSSYYRSKLIRCTSGRVIKSCEKAVYIYRLRSTILTRKICKSKYTVVAAYKNLKYGEEQEILLYNTIKLRFVEAITSPQCYMTLTLKLIYHGVNFLWMKYIHGTKTLYGTKTL